MLKAIRLIIYAILTLPLVVTPFTIFPFHFGKALFFQILVVIGLALLVFSWLKTGQFSIKHSLYPWVSLFIVAISLVSLFGENIERSLEGVYFRNNGLIMWWHLLGFFILLVSTIKTKKEWRQLFRYFVSTGTLVAIVGLAQRFFDLWPGLINRSERIFSTIGNPIFLGAYLLFVTFLTVYLVITSGTKREKRIWALVLALNLLAVYLTESGGVFLGLAAGLGISFFLMLFKTKVRWIRLALVGVALILMVSGLSFLKFKEAILYGPLKSYLQPLDRISHISLEGGTGATRLLAWQMGLAGFRARPFLGWGIANFETVADRYYNPKLLEHSFAETVWDRPHNILIEIASETGLAGLLAFLLLWVMLFRALWKNVNFSDGEKIVLSALLVAYLVQNNFGIDTVSSLVSWFFIMAFVGLEPGEVKTNKKKSIWFLAVGLLILAVFLYRWSLRPLLASYYVNQAELATYEDGEEWENNALQVLRYQGVYAHDFRLNLARNILYWDGQNNLPYIDLKKGLLALVASFEQLTKDFPEHFNYHYYLGQLYQVLGEREHKDYFNKSEQSLWRARELSPNRQATTFILGKNYFLAGELEKAKKEMETIIKQYPGNLDGHLYYGLIMAKLGNYEQAMDEFLRLAKGGYNDSNLNFLIELGEIIKSWKTYDKLLVFYEALVDLHKKEGVIIYKTAEAQYLTGQKELAEETISRLKNDTGAVSDIDRMWTLFKRHYTKR